VVNFPSYCFAALSDLGRGGARGNTLLMPTTRGCHPNGWLKEKREEESLKWDDSGRIESPEEEGGIETPGVKGSRSPNKELEENAD